MNRIAAACCCPDQFRTVQFRKVLCQIGSSVDSRGGHNYPPTIRKSDTKPSRVFLRDGVNDLDNQFGNWAVANKPMAKALEFKDDDFKLVAGTGTRNGKHGVAILLDSRRPLWRDRKCESP